MPASFSVLSPSEIVHWSGMFGLTMRQPRVVLCIVCGPAGKPFSGLRTTHGARLIDSTPPTRITSASPVSIARDACIAASRLEPHRRLIVVPGVEVGSPASSAAMRATLRFSSPAPFALPNMTSSTVSSELRLTISLTTWAPRSSGRTPASAPP